MHAGCPERWSGRHPGQCGRPYPHPTPLSSRCLRINLTQPGHRLDLGQGHVIHAWWAHALAHHTPVAATYPEYRLRNGRLFFGSRCVVPRTLHIPVIHAWHSEQVHAGSKAIYEDLRRRFVIDGLAEKHCAVCQAVLPANQVKEGFLLPHPVPDRPHHAGCRHTSRGEDCTWSPCAEWL